ncbi:MAG: hypothetical protein HFI94_10395 [Lachnospiraceae bacterium]|jgi:YbbR domain-containing protein|nr:hypothetical protein [Lachnospiraceae bacterium]
MKKKLTANLGLKILAVLFSVAIWFIVININDPVDKQVFRNIPVEILHEEAVINAGKVYEILDGTDVIDVTVWAKRSILDTLGEENIIATADMQEINFMDTMVRIKLSTNKYSNRLESIGSSTENMLVSIEDLKREQFVISVAPIGEPAEGYIIGNISTDQNAVSVSGPESIVSQVDRAEVSVNAEGLTQDIRTNVSIRLYDKDNKPVEDVNLKKSLDQVLVTLEILETRRVPLGLTFTGEPADGYALTGVIESNPSTVQIAGKGSTIRNISQIDIPDSVLDVTGCIGNLVETVELKQYLPDNVIIAEPDFNGKATITVHIEREITSRIAIDTNEVTIRGVPENMEARIESPEDIVNITVRGLSDHVSALNEAEIAARINLEEYMARNNITELEPGSYEIPLVLNLPEGIRQEEDVSVQVIISDTAAEHNNEE